MAEIEVVCPSGLRGVVRGLKMREFKMFSDRRAMKSGKLWDAVMEACWVETTEHGHAYKGAPKWTSEALQGDRFAALMAVRRATHGDVFDFTVTCPDRACRASIPWSVDISGNEVGDDPAMTAVRMKPYPVASLERHARGERFHGTLGGRAVEFGLMTVQDEKMLAKFLEPREEIDRMISVIAYRLRKIEGIGSKDDAIAWIEELDLADVLAFRDELDAVSGGIDTTFAVECNACGMTTEVELPFAGKEFWTPTTKAKARVGQVRRDSSSMPATSGSGETS